MKLRITRLRRSDLRDATERYKFGVADIGGETFVWGRTLDTHRILVYRVPEAARLAGQSGSNPYLDLISEKDALLAQNIDNCLRNGQAGWLVERAEDKESVRFLSEVGYGWSLDNDNAAVAELARRVLA